MFYISGCYSPELTSAVEVQLHIFVDASESAFAAVGYFRIVSKYSEIQVIFIAGKTKYAPQKLLSVPKLELQAAVLGTRLMLSIINSHNIKINKCYLWSDSDTVIHWIRSDYRKYKPFVAHKVAEILDSTHETDWYWLPSKVNPADEATRAKLLPKIDSNNRWIKGPEFLNKSENNWPVQTTKNNNHIEEEIRPKYKQMMIAIKFCSIINIDRFSKFLKLIRVTAWLFRYLYNCKANISKNQKKKFEK